LDHPIERRKPQGLQKSDRLPDVDAARKEWAELEGEIREQLARLGPEAVERTIEYQVSGVNYFSRSCCLI
jgi:hypothetical protein